jgi:predicted N-acetyltransferase YhbS
MEIRRATTAADRLAVMEVWHAATGSDQPLAWHQALRLRLLRRHEGTWWMLEEEGHVASSLVCYPLRFARDGIVVEGYGLGAVATRPEARRRGRAAALCARAIEAAELKGRTIGLLFSALPPAYYERLGFQASPAWHPVCSRAADLAASGPRAELVPLDPRGDVEALLACYRGGHDGLHVHRDVQEWSAGLTRGALDLFFGLGGPLRGYVRLNPEEAEGLEVVELMVPRAERAEVLRAVAGLAADLGRDVVEGWFDPVAEVAPFFEDRGRATTLPMFRGVREVADVRIWGSDYF